MAANPFQDWLAEVAADPVVIHPDDAKAEARDNLWTFGLDNEQRAAVTVADVEAFVRTIAAQRAMGLAARGTGPMQFYCWHDAQAGQLRLSLVSAGRPLPFGCQVAPSAELRVVIREFLGAVARAPAAALPVWVITVPEECSAEPAPAPDCGGGDVVE